MSSKREKLTRKEKIALEQVMQKVEETNTGFGVFDLMSSEDISYPAAYKLLENLKEKGYVREEWEKKGHKKKYLPEK